MTYIMVLADGETYTQLSGCSIVAIADDAETSEIEDFLRSEDLRTGDGRFALVTVFDL